MIFEHNCDSDNAIDPLSIMAQVLPMILSGAGHPAAGKCVGWILGQIAGDEEGIGDQLADMNQKLDRISAQIAELEKKFSKAVEEIILEQRRIHWEQMVADIKPHIARIETVYQRVQGLAALEDRDEAREYIPQLTDEILSATTGIEYAIQVIHDLVIDSMYANGFLSTWSVQVHDAAHAYWLNLIKGDPALEDDLKQHIKRAPEINTHAQQVYYAQTEAIFAYLIGVQMKGLILLVEAAHVKSGDDRNSGKNLFDYFIDRYQKLMGEQCDHYLDIVEKLTGRLSYFSFICWDSELGDDGYEGLGRADRLVGSALGYQSLIAVRCNWFPHNFKHRLLQPGHKFMGGETAQLKLTNGSTTFLAQNNPNGQVNPCTPYKFIDESLSLNNPMRRWLFVNLPAGTYSMENINSEAPVLKISGSTLAWGRLKNFINPTYFNIPLKIEPHDNTHFSQEIDTTLFYKTLNFKGYHPNRYMMGDHVVAEGKQMSFIEESLIFVSPF